MKSTLLRALALVVLASVTSGLACAAAPTNDEVGDLSRRLFQEQSFRKLDALADGYRKAHTVTRQGYMALQQFYTGIRDLCPDDADEDKWKPLHDAAEKWIRLNPRSSTAVVVAAGIQICHSSRIRGGRTADKTPRENMDKFLSGIEVARTLLDSNGAMASIDPGWYALRIDVANFQGDEKNVILDLAKRGLDLEPRMFGIHYSAITALLPRWGGNAGLMAQMIRIGDAHVSAEVGDQFYGRVTYVLARDYGPQELIADGIDLKRAHDSFRLIVARYPEAKNYNYAAAISCLIHDSEGLNEYLAKIGPDLDPSAWFRQKQFMDDCVAAAHNPGRYPTLQID